MNKKTIVLADNSYTIRRIVELSFSEEEEIELISFEDGANLKEQLLELKPEIVLVDIKLPEFSGYEVCKFINTTESLNHTKVFLLKGGFEPIDESLLTNLKYASIITKPFDSNALVATIKKILTSPAKRTPATVPEETPSFVPGDLPEVESLTQPESEIDFSDVKEESRADGILNDRVSQGTAQYLPSDEVLPSEEITQGTQPEVDTLAPSKEEEMDNPFEEEISLDRSTQKTLSEEEMDIKMNIQMQEKELEIDSLTQEEIQIKKNIKEREESSPADRLSMNGKPGADTPGSVEEVVEKEKETIGEVPDSQPGVKTEKAERPLQIDDLLEQKKAEAPGIEKYPNIEKALGQEEIDFEKELKPEPDIMNSIPSPEEKPEHPDFEPAQQIKRPPEVESKIEIDEQIPVQKEPERKEMAEPQDMGAPEIEFEFPETAGPSVTEGEAIEETEEEKETIPGPEVETPTIRAESAEKTVETPAIKKEELLYKVEDKLTLAIKEILWDVIPPMAEKIIKSEIEKLKEEVDKSFEYIEK